MSNGTFRLSNQALGAVMMALQESLLNEIDIVPILKGFELTAGDDGLVVTNPLLFVLAITDQFRKKI
jgi:hypothetical protein